MLLIDNNISLSILGDGWHVVPISKFIVSYVYEKYDIDGQGYLYNIIITQKYDSDNPHINISLYETGECEINGKIYPRTRVKLKEYILKPQIGLSKNLIEYKNVIFSVIRKRKINKLLYVI